ncbi:MAG: acetylglutamate kinase [Candidatus Izemoplasmatales bacterium]|nr:acetylglutamate kinase [Candidatus Izemoplasmatales bacterium]
MKLNGQSMDRASILITALPYIQKFYGKTIVIKYGGNAMINEELKEAVIEDIVLLSLVGIKVVFVHGGGPEINDLLKKIGKKSEFIQGLRYTDDETIDVVQMVLAGKINKNLVSKIQDKGGKALGICGLDSDLLVAKRHEKDGLDFGYVGDIIGVNVGIINDAIERNYIPVVATVAKGEDGHAYNINADTAAAKIAAALQAEKLILLTDVRGLLRDKNDENTLIETVKLTDVEALEKEGIISGGMIPKVECCVEANKSGVSRSHIIDGREKHSILIELLSDEGIGTMFI